MLSVYATNVATYSGIQAAPTISGASLAGQSVSVSKDSSVTPFAQMATERKSIADQIAGVATGILGALGVQVTASGSGVQVTRPAQMPQDVYSIGQPTPIYENPLFLGGVALVVAVLLLRK